MKKKFIGGIALLTVTLTFVFAMNLKAQDTDDTDTSSMKDDVEQICCNKAFPKEDCVKINQTMIHGRKHTC